ncbi:hypothetical protein ASG01_05985 [Chryseobacterium sp. Leaf180]|uniref:DUF4251 domain-containing protein n=1 Tax=Chryseobacterium sp. Leaf180 TaxID=1736289 RepID=UPI0006FD1362|nr:DUF4251 domain-containing protein [Chryseobacterium sp. Leaf180]KQR95394.1 hypothetical protein ASG01_05985 [Chryseobacterium sp. Leaf180]
MKNYLKIFSAFVFLSFIFQCTAQKTQGNSQAAALVASGEFTFNAERAHPLDYDVLNVLNSLPNAPASRVLQLNGQGYVIEIRKEKVEVALPYFGRVFNPSIGRQDNSLRFTTKDFALTNTPGKKGKTVFRIKPRDNRDVSDINIEVFTNGKAFVSIKSNDRQPITFDGYISKNEEPKEKL